MKAFPETLTFCYTCIISFFAGHYIYLLVMLIMKNCCIYLIICRHIIFFRGKGHVSINCQ